MNEAVDRVSQAAQDCRLGWEQLKALLVPGEDVHVCAVEHPLYALLHRRHLAAATSGRFIFMTRPLLGGYQPFDIRWQDLKDANVTVGMFTATVTLAYSANLSDTSVGEAETRRLAVSSLRKEEAQALYRACQAQEQAWREKRRIRSIEEMRAHAGGIQIATGAQSDVVARAAGLGDINAAASETPAQRLARAKEMLAQGLITDSEYEGIKARIIDAL